MRENGKNRYSQKSAIKVFFVLAVVFTGLVANLYFEYAGKGAVPHALAQDKAVDAPISRFFESGTGIKTAITGLSLTIVFLLFSRAAFPINKRAGGVDEVAGAIPDSPGVLNLLRSSVNRVQDRGNKFEGQQGLGLAEQNVAGLVESERKLSQHLQQTPLGFIEWDLKFKVINWNKSAEKIFEYTKEEAMARHAVGLIFPEDKQEDFIAGWYDPATQQCKTKSSCMNKTKTGRAVACEWYNTLLLNVKGEVVGMASLVQDVTGRKQVEEKLLQSQLDWEETFNTITDMITIHDNDFNIVTANKAAREALGLPVLLENKVKCFKFYHGKPARPTECPSCNCRTTSTPCMSELYEPHSNRFFEIRAIPRMDSNNKPKGLIHVVRDVSDRKKMEHELRQRALYDTLTKMPNRALFMDRLSGLFELRKRQPDSLFAILFIDLDHFKKINDTLGHAVGDELLISVGQRISECMRPGDTVSRFGGDEFAVILTDLKSRDDVHKTVLRVMDMFGKSFTVRGNKIYTTASIGIAISNEGHKGPDDMVRDADIAMFNAKGCGRACYVVFDPSLHKAAVESMQLETDMKRALKNNEFVLHYQPIIDLATGDIAGFEALVRWQHPKLGLILPKKFICLAEETGFIVPLGNWVLREACSQTKIWLEKCSGFFNGSSFYVTVNLSPKQFNPGLPDEILGILEEFQLNPKHLRLEITESVIMENSVLAGEVMSKLRDLDLKLYLDDFGTGYSSLNYLHKFRVDALKIDSSFVRNISSDKEAQEIVKAITMLAQNLNMSVIAEGIEDVSQLEMFRAFKCDYIQGYLFSRPMDPAHVEKYLEEHHIVEAQV